MVTFVFSNPRHHVDMMVPVARELAERGVPFEFVSLAELRGFSAPDLGTQLPGTTLKRAVPYLRKDPAAGAGVGTGSTSGAIARRLARRALWTAALGPRLRWLLRRSDLVVVPNDVAYPYDRLAHTLRALHRPFVLLQEGIRFPLPTEKSAGLPYGSNGAAAVCAWGEASADHFRSVGAARATIRITGNPRFDGVDPRAWTERGTELRNKLGIAREPLLYLSNTIDDMGFCTTAEKMQLFERFLAAAAPVVAAEQRTVVVKLHPREDRAAFEAIAARASVPVAVLVDEPLFAVLAMGRAAVVLASTVGLEALAFGLPLAVLEIPGHGQLFEYVAHEVAVPLWLDRLAGGLTALLATQPDAGRVARFLERHMAHRGFASRRIADTLVELRGNA
ncbi:MAG: hypothetical protein KF773_01805 [Deltaproteobacteria bacterium]|nr:hypothetical protein [Deltaproteobacteria bacterium]